MITRTEVVQAAKLARLSLSDAEAARIAGDLERVVAYVEQLMSVDVSHVEPMIHPTSEGACPTRADEESLVLGRRALEGSAGYDDGLVRVPKVVE